MTLSTPTTTVLIIYQPPSTGSHHATYLSTSRVWIRDSSVVCCDMGNVPKGPKVSMTTSLGAGDRRGACTPESNTQGSSAFSTVPCDPVLPTTGQRAWSEGPQVRKEDSPSWLALPGLLLP